ncbi:MAG TPA: helix-turn-helix domain-containing protein [Candidatus Acidoferrales bacterium]|nr:helix-turn-helix domain-containing protein [Candidatus Acidoferrales bacterium]
MENSPEDLQLMNLADAAVILQVSKRTLLRMIQHNEVPAFKIGGQWRLRQSQLRRWLEERERGTIGMRKERERGI